MGWFEKKAEKAKIPPAQALWQVCPRCRSYVAKDEWKANNCICPACGYHGRLGARARIAQLADEGTFAEVFREVSYSDHLDFHDATGPYKTKVDSTIAKTGETESVVMGTAEMGGVPVMLGVMDFSFMGGSLGTGTGERIARACEQAIAERRPLVICSASGGARMHEGILSLMQMAKTSAAVGRVKDGIGIQIGLTESIRTPDGNGTLQAFNIDTPPAGRTVVNDQFGISGTEIVPQPVKIHDIPDLVHTASVDFIGNAPFLQRFHVEVLTEAFDVQSVDEFTDHAEQILPHLILFQPQQQIEPVQGIQPVGMFHGQICSGICPFRFHPQKELHAGFLYRSDHIQKTVRMLIGTHLPVAHLLVPVSRTGGTALSVPARIDPVVVCPDTVIPELIQMVQMPLGAHSHAFQSEWILFGCKGTQLVFDQSPEKIAALYPASLIIHQQYGGGTDAFSGMESESGVFQPCPDLQRISDGMGKGSTPLP